MNNIIIQKYLQTHNLNEKKIESLLNEEFEINEYFTDSESFIDYLHQCKNKNITIYPDYDADGICGGIVAYTSLDALNFNVNLYHPKSSLGYGLNIDSIQELLKQYPDTEVILTVDNGISTKEAVDYLNELNIKVLISDHHTGRLEYFPDKALAVVNPNRIDKNEIYPFKSISGTAVIYKLIQQYIKKYENNQYNDLQLLKIFVGISCITDVMPMLKENRYYVKESCRLMQQLFNNELKSDYLKLNDALLGLNRLLFDLMINGQIKSSDDINSTLIGFYIGPILNSPRRIYDDSDMAFKLFKGEDLSNELIELNNERKMIVQQSYNIAENLLNIMESNKIKLIEENDIQNYINIKNNAPIMCLNDKVLVYCAPIAHGIAGLLASKLMNKYQKPTIVISSNGGGSGRSLSNLSLHDALLYINQYKPNLLNKWGGHDLAAGLSTSNINEFSLQFNNYFKDKILINNAAPVVKLDIDYLNINAVKEALEFFKSLEPFNNELPQPLFNLESVIDLSKVKIMGKELNHIKIILDSNINAIQWQGNTDQFNTAQLLNMNKINCIGKLEINKFNGCESVQIMIQSIDYDFDL